MLGTAWVRRKSAVIPLILPILAVIATAVIYWVDARIRAPADPMILVIASYGAVSIAGAPWNTGSWRRLPARALFN